MKKNELKNKMNDAFSELTPNIFDGIVETVKLQEPVLSETTSEEIRKPTAKKVFIGYAMTACAALVIICLCLFGLFGEKQDSLYMVLDINPEIEIKMDKSYQVKEIEGLNQDGKIVVKGLKWKKKESIQDLMEALLEEAVEKSYLRDNEGILVTLYTSDNDVYNELESKLGECINSKLKDLKISGVTASFNQVKQSSLKKGREVLESELMEKYGFDENQVKDMSVMELIQYCQENNLLDSNNIKQSADGHENEKSKGKKEEDIQTTSPIDDDTEYTSEDKTNRNEVKKETVSKDNVSEGSTTESSMDLEYTQKGSENPSTKEQEDIDSETQTDNTEQSISTVQTERQSDETQQPTTKKEETTKNSDGSEHNDNKYNYGDYYYKLLNDNAVEITGYRGTRHKIEVPALIKNKVVTKIGAEAFSDNIYLKNVILPDGVTSIGRYAFRNCSKITKIRLPKSLKHIEDYAFFGCSSLNKVDYEGNLENWNKIQVGKKNDCLLSAKIVTKKVKVTKIKLTVTSRKIEVGDKIAVIALIKPENADNLKLEWSSSDDSMAVVDDFGLVTAVSPGMVKITASAKDGSGKSASINIRIVNKKNNKDKKE